MRHVSEWERMGDMKRTGKIEIQEEEYGDRKSGKVTEATLYHCGYCTNNLGILFRIVLWEKRNFPASVLRICHKDFGEILYDTGYSEDIFRRGIFLWFYRFILPVCFKKGDRIDEKLALDGISRENVKIIILSHNHPDHIGGLSCFPKYELIAFKEVLKQIPVMSNVKSRREPKKLMEDHFLCGYFQRVYDLFGDGSVIGIRLDGHCKGQMGLWIPDLKLFLAADAGWGRDLVRHTLNMRLVPRLIQRNFFQYKDTLGRICRMKKDYPWIQVFFSHDLGREKRFWPK